MIHRTLCLYGILALLASLLGGCQTPAEPNATASTAFPAKGGEPERTRAVFPARFQAAVYEVQAVADRVDKVEAKVLEKQAGTTEGLLKALSRTGTARVLYRFDQRVNVMAETLRIGNREPIVTGTRIQSGGQAINAIQYQQVGVVFRLSAQMPPPARQKTPDVTVSMELTVMENSGVMIAPGQNVPSIRNLSMEHKEGLEFGQPRVMLAVSSASPDQKQQPALYVIRYLFSR